ncbi:hypothetical protein H0H92_010518 [Tricholoma furcatifolium]|nr:hypothetical protein H0H92_010518 [Tricholoma furcatifolium]
MSVSMLARSSALRTVARSRSFHTTSVARSEHGHYHHLPFQFPGKNNKGAFGAKVFIFLATGFSIPFVAAKWQLCPIHRYCFAVIPFPDSPLVAIYATRQSHVLAKNPESPSSAFKAEKEA